MARAQHVTSRAQGLPRSHHRTANKVSPRHVLMRGHWPSGPWGHSLSLPLTRLCQGRSRVSRLKQAAKNMSRWVLFWGRPWEKAWAARLCPAEGCSGQVGPVPPQPLNHSGATDLVRGFSLQNELGHGRPRCSSHGARVACSCDSFTETWRPRLSNGGGVGWWCWHQFLDWGRKKGLMINL